MPAEVSNSIQKVSRNSNFENRLSSRVFFLYELVVGIIIFVGLHLTRIAFGLLKKLKNNGKIRR